MFGGKEKYRQSRRTILHGAIVGLFAMSITLNTVLKQSAAALCEFSFVKKIQLTDSLDAGPGVNYGYGYSIDPDGEIVMQGYSNGQLIYYNADGSTRLVVDLYDKLGTPENGVSYGLYAAFPATFSEDGSVYLYGFKMTDTEEVAGVLKLAPKTADVATFYEIPANFSNTAHNKQPVVDAVGNVYIINSSDDTDETQLTIYNPNGTIKKTISLPESTSAIQYNYESFSRPGKDYLYIAGTTQEGKTSVLRVNLATSEQTMILNSDITDFNNEPYGVNSDSKDNFYLFDSEDIQQPNGDILTKHYLLKYDSNGNLLGKNELPGPQDPAGGTVLHPKSTIFFDSNDNVYVRMIVDGTAENGGQDYRSVYAFDNTFQFIGELNAKALLPHANHPDEFYDDTTAGIIIVKDKLYWTAYDPVLDGSPEEEQKVRSSFVFDSPVSCRVPPALNPDEPNSSVEEIRVPNTGVKADDNMVFSAGEDATEVKFFSRRELMELENKNYEPNVFKMLDILEANV